MADAHPGTGDSNRLYGHASVCLVSSYQSQNGGMPRYGEKQEIAPIAANVNGGSEFWASFTTETVLRSASITSPRLTSEGAG